MRIVMGGASAMLAAGLCGLVLLLKVYYERRPVGALLAFWLKVYFGVPRPVPARGSKGLQPGETGVRGAVCFCASTGVGAQTNCCAYDGCGPVFRAAGEWGRLRRASLCSASMRVWEVCEL